MVLLRDVHSFVAANEVSKRHTIELWEDFTVLYRFERSWPFYTKLTLWFVVYLTMLQVT